MLQFFSETKTFNFREWQFSDFFFPETNYIFLNCLTRMILYFGVKGILDEKYNLSMS